jgi:hypothetical protein
VVAISLIARRAPLEQQDDTGLRPEAAARYMPPLETVMMRGWSAGAVRA